MMNWTNYQKNTEILCSLRILFYICSMENQELYEQNINELVKLGFIPLIENNIITSINWTVNQSDQIYHDVDKILFLMNANPKKNYIFAP